MTVLTDKRTTELVIPFPPSTVYRSVEYRGEGRWVVGPGLEKDSAFDAMMFVRNEIARVSLHPVRIEILWANVPKDFKAPTTGSTL